MKTFIKALLIAGLFISPSIFAVPDYDRHIDFTQPTDQINGYVYKCMGIYTGKPTYVTAFMDDLGRCLNAAASHVRTHLTAPPKASIFQEKGNGGFISVTNVVTQLEVPNPVTASGYSVGYKVTETSITRVCAANDQGQTTCTDRPSGPYVYTRSGAVQQSEKKAQKVCPSTHPHLRSVEGVGLKCYPNVPPLDCSKLKGMSVDGQRDYFWTDEGAYVSPNKPSCVTKCGTDSAGKSRCSNCQVTAKSFIQSHTSNGKTLWRPVIATLTGTACGISEAETPPPEPPKCWKTKNNLTMCQQDPDEKCVTINGVQQCESGCGYINNDFFCSDPDAKDPPKNDKDKPLPLVDDNITDPTKALADMKKGDFKDVQKGVESRLSVVSAGISNLENSVDTSNQILEEIKTNTGTSLENDTAQIDLLTGIKDALTGDGTGDGEGECDPNKDPNCANGGDAGTPASWWNSVYPNGMTGIIDDKRAQFQASAAYKAMTEDLTIGVGTLAPWKFCFTASVMNFGCFDVEIPSYVLSFIRLCILFGAAILCRRLLIGA